MSPETREKLQCEQPHMAQKAAGRSMWGREMSLWPSVREELKNHKLYSASEARWVWLLGCCLQRGPKKGGQGVPGSDDPRKGGKCLLSPHHLWNSKHLLVILGCQGGLQLSQQLPRRNFQEGQNMVKKEKCLPSPQLLLIAEGTQKAPSFV